MSIELEQLALQAASLMEILHLDWWELADLSTSTSGKAAVMNQIERTLTELHCQVSQIEVLRAHLDQR
jgi:hypothetical protein